MGRLGGRIYLSCNVVRIGFSFNRILFDRRILHTSHDVSATFPELNGELSKIRGPYGEVTFLKNITIDTP
jgi:hypothetical protein